MTTAQLAISRDELKSIYVVTLSFALLMALFVARRGGGDAVQPARRAARAPGAGDAGGGARQFLAPGAGDDAATSSAC